MAARKTGTKTIIILGVAAFLGAGVLVYGLLNSRAPAVQEVFPAVGDITTYYSFSGTVEAGVRELVVADRMMQVRDIYVAPGQQVARGDILLVAGTGPAIRASIAGEVSHVFVQEKAQVMPGEKLVSIIDYSSLQLRALVDEYDLPALAEGMETVVTIHALDKEVPGTVVDIAREGVNVNGVTVFEAIIALEADADVRIGMSAEARVENQSVRGVLTLPMAVIRFDEKNLPYVLVKGRGREKRPLTLGVNDGMVVEVIDGLSPDDVVIVPRENKSFDFRDLHVGARD